MSRSLRGHHKKNIESESSLSRQLRDRSTPRLLRILAAFLPAECAESTTPRLFQSVRVGHHIVLSDSIGLLREGHQAAGRACSEVMNPYSTTSRGISAISQQSARVPVRTTLAQTHRSARPGNWTLRSRRLAPERSPLFKSQADRAVASPARVAGRAFLSARSRC